MRNLDTALLRSFVVVVETGGMTAAARQLHLTQAAVSQQIKRLEDVLQLRLFDRDKREVVVTPAGERLFGKARQFLELNDEIWTDMVRPEFEGEVRLGVPHDIVSAFMPPVLKRFDRSWPRVRVSLDCSTTPRLLDKLALGELDLTLTTEPHAAHNGTTLMHEPLVWAGARGGVAHTRRPLPVSLGDERCAFRPVVMHALSRSRHDWRSVCDTGSMQALMATVEADLAVAAMLRSVIPSNLEVVGPAAGLPELPSFFVNLYMPQASASAIAVELAGHITAALGATAQAA